MGAFANVSRFSGVANLQPERGTAEPHRRTAKKAMDSAAGDGWRIRLSKPPTAGRNADGNRPCARRWPSLCGPYSQDKSCPWGIELNVVTACTSLALVRGKTTIKSIRQHCNRAPARCDGCCGETSTARPGRCHADTGRKRLPIKAGPTRPHGVHLTPPAPAELAQIRGHARRSRPNAPVLQKGQPATRSGRV